MCFDCKKGPILLFCLLLSINWQSLTIPATVECQWEDSLTFVSFHFQLDSIQRYPEEDSWLAINYLQHVTSEVLQEECLSLMISLMLNSGDEFYSPINKGHHVQTNKPSEKPAYPIFWGVCMDAVKKRETRGREGLGEPALDLQEEYLS